MTEVEHNGYLIEEETSGCEFCKWFKWEEITKFFSSDDPFDEVQYCSNPERERRAKAKYEQIMTDVRGELVEKYGPVVNDILDDHGDDRFNVAWKQIGYELEMDSDFVNMGNISWDEDMDRDPDGNNVGDVESGRTCEYWEPNEETFKENELSVTKAE
jgi:hypothetical protein